MYSPLRHASTIFWKRRPVQLTFFVTSRCNSNCPFCFYWRNRNKGRDELTLPEIDKISKSMGGLLWVLFSGGEVYLREDIAEISRVFYENNKPVFLTLPTNGLLPSLIKEKTEEILRRCKKSVVVVKLSLDGLGKDHDDLRGVEGNYDKVMETYEKLAVLIDKYPNFELGINTLFCRTNQEKMKEITAFVNDLNKITTHTISLIRGDLVEEDLKKIDLYHYRDVISTVEDNLKKDEASIYRFSLARLKAAQDILQRRMIYKTMKSKKRLIPCYAGRLNIVMDEVGDVYPCELLNLKMGNVKDYNYDLMELYHSKESERVKNRITNDKCYCSHECYFATNILFNPWLYGKLLGEYLQLHKK